MEKSKDYLSFENDKEVLRLFERDERLIFSDKLIKFNPNAWKQERNFLLTNKFLYNLKRRGITLYESFILALKRRISLLNIAAVTISSNPASCEFVVHVPMEYDYRFTSPRYQ